MLPRTTRSATSPSRRQGRLEPARSKAEGHLEEKLWVFGLEEVVEGIFFEGEGAVGSWRGKVTVDGGSFSIVMVMIGE